MTAAEATWVEVEGRRVRLTNLAKPYWPATGFTKGDLVAYFRAVAPALLPHLAGRPLTLGRHPDGVEGRGWFQTNCPPGKPAWMPVAPVVGRGGGRFRYCVVNDLASLLWVANTGALELHPFLAAAASPDRPLLLVLDLDPGPPAGLLACAEVALEARRLLAAAGLRAFAKTSGWSGLHVVVPLDGTQRFEESKRFGRAVAAALAAARPARVVDRMARAERVGRVLVDWRQNDASLSTAAPYSPRATPLPRVSTPLGWGEVEEAVAAGDERRLAFGPRDVIDRLDRLGDLFRPVVDEPQRLPAPEAIGAG